MKNLKKLPMIALASALGLAAGGANAADVESQIFGGALNQLSDNSAESQDVDLNKDGFLGVGDTLRGILTIETVENLTTSSPTNSLGGASGNNELSAIFVTEVVSMSIVLDFDGSCSAIGADCAGTGVGLTGDETANYVFGANAAFAGEFGLSAGTMVAFFEDTTPDYSRTGTIAAAEATATDGTLVLEAGINGSDADELWNAFNAPTDVSLLNTIPNGTIAGGYNVQLSFVGVNALFPTFQQVEAGCNSFLIPTYPCGGDGQIDLNGSGSILGTKGADTGYDGFNNVDFTVFVVPAPGVLALFGIGLLGMGAVTRRRKSTSA